MYLLQLIDSDLNALKTINNKYVKAGLTYGWPSNVDKSYDQGHWNRQILINSEKFPYDQLRLPHINKHPEVKAIWNTIKNSLGDRSLLRVYVNGYTYGTDGYAHIDDIWIKRRFGDNALSETAVVYLNELWNLDWAGETVMFNNEGDITASVLPKFGRVFIFNSSTLHGARPVSRSCTELRKVIVFKTIDTSTNSREVDAIVQRSYDREPLLEHVYDTMIVLEKMKTPSTDTILAGLYHTAYKDFEFTRDELKSIIGEYSERLVHIYTTMELTSIINSTLDYDVVKDLLRIEYASIIATKQSHRYEYSLNLIKQEMSKWGEGDIA